MSDQGTIRMECYLIFTLLLNMFIVQTWLKLDALLQTVHISAPNCNSFHTLRWRNEASKFSNVRELFLVLFYCIFMV